MSADAVAGGVLANLRCDGGFFGLVTAGHVGGGD